MKHAASTVPFYKKMYQENRVNPEDVVPENWADVPILSREMLQGTRIVSSDIPGFHGQTMTTTTSGSTGEPVIINTTTYAQSIWHAFSLREHLWHKRDFSGRHASIKYIPGIVAEADGTHLPNWCPIMAQFFETGPSMHLCIKNSVDRQLKWLEQQNPHYLVTYPSNLQALLEKSVEDNVRLDNLKEVRTIGETVGPNLRRACRDTWGVRAVDTYSSQEVGYIAIECPTGEHYHVQAENVFLEVLDPDGQPCQPGEIGRVVATSLHNFATPLIRYEIRDYAEVGSPCSCGRGLPVINRIVGRQRNMLIMPTGEKHWPVFGMLEFRQVVPIKQMQFVQHSVELLEFNYTAERVVTEEEKMQLQVIIHKSLGHPFSIRFTQVEQIPQRENGKIEDFISHIV